MSKPTVSSTIRVKLMSQQPAVKALFAFVYHRRQSILPGNQIRGAIDAVVAADKQCAVVEEYLLGRAMSAFDYQGSWRALK